MLTYTLRRLLLMIPTLLGITLVVFAIMAAAPGGISAQALIEGQNLEPQAQQALTDYYNRLYGLDQPLPLQYLRWLNNVSPMGFVFDEQGDITGFSLWKGADLGDSFRYGRPVADLLAERVPITVLLNVLSIPLIYAIAIAVGVRAATERGGAFDIGSSVTMLALWSVPTMLTGVLLIGFFASDQYWHWFPTAGLSHREALSMPFMPHWSNPLDALRLLAGGLLGTAIAVGLGLRGGRWWRTVGMALGGGMAGWLMVGALPQANTLGYSVLILLLASLGAGIGYLGYGVLRVAAMATIGLVGGLLLTAPWLTGEFTRGFLLDRLWHLVLPVVCLAYAGFAFLSRLTRSAVLENLLADYARTARAKGLAERDVLWRHVFRNSLIPLITVAANLLPALLMGSVIVESIFSIDGMGKLAVEAVKDRDRELVLSIALISGLLNLLGYLLADIAYAIVDPRVSYD